MSVNDKARTASYHRLYCGMSDTVKGQLTYRVSQILKRKLLSLLDFRDFQQCSDTFPGYWFFWTFPSSGVLETRKHDELAWSRVIK
jgi:hypothetical protein